MLPLTGPILLLALGFSADGDSTAADRGQTALRAGDFASAIEQFEKQVASNPADTESWMLLAHSCESFADQLPTGTEEEWNRVAELLGKAESALREALQRDSENGDAWAALGRNLLKQGNASEAIVTLYHCRQFRDNDLSVLRDLSESLLLARTYALENGDESTANSRLEEAEGVLTEALGLATAHADLLRSMADVQVLRGDEAAAQVSLRKAISLRPSDVSLHDAYLQSNSRTKHFDEGLRFYGGLVDAEPLALWYASETHLLQGHVHFNVDKDFAGAAAEYAAAEEGLRRSARSEPEYRAAALERIPFVRSYRGYALLKAGDLAGAEAAFLAALDRTPGLANALQGLQAVMDEYWNRMGGEGAPPEKFDELRAFTARLCIAAPTNADFWNNYGFFAREAHKYEEAFQAYRRAVELAPLNARFLNDAALILVYHLHRDLDWAEDMLIEARDLSVDSMEHGKSNNERADSKVVFGDALVNLITLHDQLGQKEEAIKVFRQLEAELPDRYEVRIWQRRLVPEEVPPRNGDGTPPAAGHGEAGGGGAEGGGAGVGGGDSGTGGNAGGEGSAGNASGR